MRQFSKLEVVITQKGKQYEAICEAFPKCTGMAASQEGALEALCDAIAGFVGDVTRSTFKSILLAQNYTQVLLDGSKKSKRQHRIFSLEAGIKNPMIAFKVKPLPEHLEMPQPSMSDFEMAEFVAPNESSHSRGFHQGENIAVMTKIPLPSYPEGCFFGFPLNFN